MNKDWFTYTYEMLFSSITYKQKTVHLVSAQPSESS